MKAGRILWIIKESKVVSTCPTRQALSIHTVGTIAQVSMRAVKTTSIKTGVRKHREIRSLQLCWWRLAILYPLTSTHNHSVSDLSGDCFKNMYLVAHKQTWQGHASGLKRTQLVQSLELLAFPKKCSGFPVIR